MKIAPKDNSGGIIEELDWDQWSVGDENDGRFQINDPHNLRGLVYEASPDQVVSVLKVYPNAQQYVPCAFCVQKQLHRKGLVVELSDGRTALMGHDCGARYLDEKFDALLAIFKHRRETVYYSERVAPLHMAIAQVLEAMDGWNEGHARIELFRKRLRLLWPEVFEELRTAARYENGRLTGTRRVRDRVAEDQRDAKLKDDDPKYGSPIWRQQNVQIGRLHGSEAFVRSPNIDLRKARSDLEEVLHGLKPSSKDGLLKMKGMSRKVSDARARLKQVVVLYDNFRQFLSDDNLELIARWARKTDLAELQYADGCLFEVGTADDGNDKRLIRVELPCIDGSVLGLLQTSATY